MADRTLTINHADGGSETYTIKRDKFAGVREMSIDGSTVTVDHTAVPKEQSKETTFGGSKSITIKREIEPLLSEVVGGASAAYSLRDLNDKAGNSKVVRVRRSSDNAEADFKAKEVSDGTLVDWVNTNTNGVFANEGFEAFSGASESGFTAHNSIENSAATTTASSGSTGDVVVVSFDLDISEGSPALSLRTFSTGGTLASNFVIYTESGNYTATFTATTTFRAVGFTEGDAPSSFTVNNFKILNDGFVETWYDQSGNGNDAVQQVSGSQPKIVDAGVLVSGGLDFDGVDDTLVVTGNPVITANHAGAYSAFSVHNIPTNETGYITGNASTTNGTSVLAKNTSEFALTNKNSGGLDTISRTAGENLLSACYNNGDASLLVNGGGSMASVGTYDFAAGTSDFRIASRNPNNSHLLGTIQEIIIYDSDQSDNRTAIETNINNQYDIY